MIKNMAKTNMIFNRNKSESLEFRFKKIVQVFIHSPKLLLNVCTVLCSKNRKSYQIHSDCQVLLGPWEWPKLKMRTTFSRSFSQT